jgi:hypothetical protein
VRTLSKELAIVSNAASLPNGSSRFIVPAVIADQGDKAAERFFTFFTDTIPTTQLLLQLKNDSVVSRMVQPCLSGSRFAGSPGWRSPFKGLN